MAHFARVEDGIVVQVLKTSDNMPNEGHDFLLANFGGTWIKTSYNTRRGEHLLGGTPLRKNYAGIGYTYDTDRDAFIPPRPFESWELNEVTCQWAAPVPYPEDPDIQYVWSEDELDWVAVTE